MCHYNYSHNGNNVSAGSVWPGTYYTFVNIDFDPSANPANANGPTYRGNAVPTTGNGGTGACGGLYCHGNGAAQSDWGGTTTATPPVWDNTVSAACGSCHAAGSGLSPGNHAAHLSAAYGPGIAAFSAAGTCSEGTGCHTAYDLNPTGNHANARADFRISPSVSTPATLSSKQICRNCHQQSGLAMSMTEKNHSPENALAERVNGILKQEYWLDATFENRQQARQATAHGICMYNTRRPHTALNFATPEQVHHANEN